MHVNTRVCWRVMHVYLFWVDEKKRKCFVCEEKKRNRKKKERKGKNLLLSFSHYVLIASCFQNIPTAQSVSKEWNETEFNWWFKLTACSIPRQRPLLCVYQKQALVKERLFCGVFVVSSKRANCIKSKNIRWQTIRQKQEYAADDTHIS